MKDRFDQLAWFWRFWRQHWRRIIFRLHKDRRAWSAILVLTGIVAYVAYYGFLLIKQPGSLVLLALGLAVACVISRSNAKDQESLIRLSQYSTVESGVSPHLISELRSKMLRLAFLLWRARSEAHLGDNPAEQGLEIITRRVILDKLNELGLREMLESDELDLHLLPDGGWSMEKISGVLMQSSHLQVLQYCLGQDRFLAPIEELWRLPSLDTERLRNLSAGATWTFQETSDIRTQRDEAAFFYLRCFSEQRRRGLASEDLEEELEVMLKAVSVNTGDESRDLLLGVTTIAGAATEHLRLASMQSYARFKSLGGVLQLVT